MSFVDAVAVLRRHKLLAVYGVLAAVVLATFSAFRFEGTTLVDRGKPSYQTTAVVAIRPGPEQLTTPVGPVPTTVAPAAPDPAVVDPNAPVATTVPPTTVPTPPLAPLAAVIDSRAMYYTTLSLKTVVLSPGFAEAVRGRAPTMDGSIVAVVAQDTNTMDVVVDGSTPAIAAATMSAALSELQTVVVAYSSTPATRFALDGVVISAPSAPRATSSIRTKLTFTIVLAVVAVLWWFLIRAVDAVGLDRRRTVRRNPGGSDATVPAAAQGPVTKPAAPPPFAAPEPVGGVEGTPVPIARTSQPGGRASDPSRNGRSGDTARVP